MADRVGDLLVDRVALLELVDGLPRGFVRQRERDRDRLRRVLLLLRDLAVRLGAEVDRLATLCAIGFQSAWFALGVGKYICTGAKCKDDVLVDPAETISRTPVEGKAGRPTRAPCPKHPAPRRPCGVNV